MVKRTITLSDRPPVTIDEDDWTLIAQASDKEYDNEFEFQANRISTWSIKVRTRDDEPDKDSQGKPATIVSAVYNYTSNWTNARGFQVRHGVLLPEGESDTQAICRAIKEVCNRMAASEHHGDDADRWEQLADDCIADLPAEEL